MEQKDRQQEERRPGKVEDREEDRRGQQLPDRIEIAQTHRGRRFAGEKRAARERGAKHPRIEPCLEPRRDARHDAGPREVQDAHHREQEDDQDEQRKKRLLGPAAEYPVIDLEHEERPGQHQEIHEGRKERDRDEERRLRGARAPQLCPAAADIVLRHLPASCRAPASRAWENAGP